MGRINIDDLELDEDDQNPEGRNRRSVKKNADQPKWSPIRRKDKMRSEDGLKPKAKRNHKKVQQRIKYEWKED